MNGLGGLLEAGVLTNIVCLFRVYSKCISAARDFGNSRSGGAHFDYIRSLKFCVWECSWQGWTALVDLAADVMAENVLPVTHCR